MVSQGTALLYGTAGSTPSGRQRCPECHQGFTSPSAQYCPFDGSKLEPDPTRVADPMLGVVVDGRYEIMTLLGEGGMGRVYRARHRALGKEFALKVLRTELANEAAVPERFLREARAAAAISHPSVVKITDFGVFPDGAPYFVMELLEGRSLAALLRQRGALPAALAARLSAEIAKALSAAHDAGVVHRDLKSENIHLGGEGPQDYTVKVLDFGLAKVAGSSRLTRQGMVFGTPYYMSPEQAMGETVDARSDVYSLGIIMYEMFTGRLPFVADTFMGVLTQHLRVAPKPPSTMVDPSLAPLVGAYEPILLRCLAKRPEERFQSMAELLGALESTLGHPGAGSAGGRQGASPLGAARSSAAAQRSKVPMVLLGLGVLLGGLGMVAGALVWARSRGASVGVDAAGSGALASAQGEPLASALAESPARAAPSALATEPPPPPQGLPAESARSAALPTPGPAPRAAGPGAPPPARPKKPPAAAIPPAPAPPAQVQGSEIVNPWAQ